MTQDEALAAMQKIDERVAVLRAAHSRYNLIAAGTIESPEEIAIQSAKADAEIAEVEKKSIDEGVAKNKAEL